MWCSGYRLEAYKTTPPSNLLGNNKWEVLLGAMSPLQALCFDIVLFSLALIILLFHPRRVLHSRPWFIKNRKEEPK